MIKNLGGNIKRVDNLDICLIKLCTAAVVLFIITVWPAAMALVQLVNPWYFFVAAIIFGARPLYKLYVK